MKTLVTAAAIGALSFAAGAHAVAQPPVALPGGTVVSVPVRTYTDLRFKEVIRQAYDVSCGAAAVATLFTHYYGEPISEKKIIDLILETASKQQKQNIERAGFSMLELKNAGEELGFQVGGFKLPEAAKLGELQVPAITLTNVRGYNHFVVIKGVKSNEVYLADPAFGNRVRTLDEFSEEWNGVVLVFVDQDRDVDRGFTLNPSIASPTRELTVLLDKALHGIRPLPGEF